MKCTTCEGSLDMITISTPSEQSTGLQCRDCEEFIPPHAVSHILSRDFRVEII